MVSVYLPDRLRLFDTGHNSNFFVYLNLKNRLISPQLKVIFRRRGNKFTCVLNEGGLINSGLYQYI